MPDLPKTILVTDEDTIAIVHVFKERKDESTYTKALQRLVSRAKDAGLHLYARPLNPPITGTVQPDGTVTPNPD